MSDRFEHLPAVADELCVYQGLQVDSVDHPTACYQMNTGNRFGGDPAVGAWTTYGLGTVNQNLPAFVVLPEGAFPQGGAANWSNGFLPAHFQGTPLRPSGSPILDLVPAYGRTPRAQRANLDLLAELNQADLARHPHHAELAARMEAYELAFRMQAEVPGVIDLSKEDQTTLDLYGIGQPADRQLRPPLPAGPQAGASRRAVRAALRGRLGLARLPRAGPHAADQGDRPADRRADRRPEAAGAARRARWSSGAASSAARPTTASAAAGRSSAATTTPRR